ncbi:thioredoxin-like [Rattus norvegicus]|uniref:thioredoxin-like n=1 Tax=Rattus norvegicus TaxID=10116 RepID=UPI0000DA1A25|nr:thioredoxin-like [Rattus norvegicus]
MKQIKSLEAFQEALDASGDDSTVLDFPGPCCGPCRMTRFLSSLSELYSNVLFLDVDADDCWDIAANCGAKCMLIFNVSEKGSKAG